MNEEVKKMQDIRARLAGLAIEHDPESGHSIDIETDHAEADRLLCQLLLLHDEQEAVINFRAIRKWYA